MTAPVLAAELEVSVRTIQRDIDALSAVGVPVYSERGRAGGYRLAGGYRSRLTGLDSGEAQALVAFATPGAARELGLGQALLSAQLKLAAALPGRLRAQAISAADRFHLDVSGWFTPRRPAAHLDVLAAAVFGDLTVEARYRGRAGPRDCRLQPLGLVLKAGTWYLIASEHDAIRGYRADRLDQVTVTGEQFSRPPGFDLSAFWVTWRDEFERGLPVVTVTVRARSHCIHRLRHAVEQAHAHTVDWHTPPDQAGWSQLVLPFEKLDYARAALLGFGADVEVIDPRELRGQMIATTAALSALYAPRMTSDGPDPTDAMRP